MKKKIHMIGIGGIGISSLAQLYVHQGHTVTGTNDNPSPQTLDRVRALGVEISEDIAVSAVPSDVDFFVYSDAWLSLEPAFLEAVRALGKPMFSYFEALGEATKEGTSIVVSGTHGKTTTTAMLAKILIDAGQEPTVIAGSILSEQGSNFVAGRPDLFVIEGCEYRRHFLHLHPDILIINNIELDHTDYYRDLADMQDAFRAVASRVPDDGVIVTDTDAGTIAGMLQGLRARVVPYQHATVPTLKVPGEFNESNARAAKAAAYALEPDLHEADIDRALADFRGTWRRFEYKGETQHGALVYDDYAHHPTATRNTIDMVRAAFADKRLVLVFHPHLYSRTRDFMDAFADALSGADEVLLAPIYPAREEPIEGVTSAVLAEKVVDRGTPARAFDSFDDIVAHLRSTERGPSSSKLKTQNSKLILTMGAGDVYHVADALVV